MTTLVIPPPVGPHTKARVALTGATYAIRWLWNDRDRAWTFSMWDPDGQPLVMGVRVALEVDLLAAAGSDTTRRPPFPLAVIDPTGTAGDVTYASLMTGVHKVLYPEADE